MVQAVLRPLLSRNGLERSAGRTGAAVVATACLCLAAASFISTPSPASAAECPNEALRQEQGVTALPNCMALEMATPPVKFNRQTVHPSFSANGNRLQFESAAPLGDTEGQLSPINDTYLASRGGSGWNTTATSPPADYGFGWAGISTGGQPLAFSPEFDRWFSLQSTLSQGQNGQMTAFEADMTGSWSPRSELLVPLGPHHTIGLIRFSVNNLTAVSADYTHLFVRPGDRENANSFAYAGSYLPGDPHPYAGGTTGPTTAEGAITWNTYVASDGPLGDHRLALVARDSGGHVWGGQCGAFVGGGGSLSIRGGRNQGSVSADGRHVYLSTRPAQGDGAACPSVGTANLLAGNSNVTVAGPVQPFSVGQGITGGTIPPGTTITAVVGQTLTLTAPPTANGSNVALTATHPMRILERTEAADGQATIEELEPAEPLAGSDYYEGASVDQSKVYFTSSRKLAPTDQDPNSEECSTEVKLPTATSVGCDLYLYEELPGGGHQTIQVSAGGVGAPTPGVGANVYKGVTAISGDGSHVYFAAQGVSTTDPNPEGAVAEAGKLNLYLYERDAAHPGGRTAFVGQLDPTGEDATKIVGEDLSSYSKVGAVSAVPMRGQDNTGGEVGGDGHVLFIRSATSLTANDQDGGRLDLFRYGADDPSLTCVSCLPGGVGDHGAYDVKKNEKVLVTPGPEFAEYRRWTAETGNAAIFATDEPLLPEDINGGRSDYLWQGGSLTLLPGDGPEPAISHDGSAVAFETFARLLPADGDSAVDIYVARVDGGFPFRPPQTACSGEACQGPPAGAPAGLRVGSSAFVGGGNVKPNRRHAKKPHRKHKSGKQHGRKKQKRDRRVSAEQNGGRK